ncbi:hypothetical protein [Paenibacillus sp. GbtcB18]|uniref:hypothetical protein n=1 Tax=Paenibacillus sp. GbtcB18 TaxID=2824763 RepID=UPI001C302981|nr:hypothetical protein [Paenibacillus sp. GbtcB18]
MEKKRCLFCDQIVPIGREDGYDLYTGCYCSPDGSYGLHRDSYDPYSVLSYQTKHLMFPVISAYIRELTDCGETVRLTIDDLEAIRNSPRVPVTIEDKGIRLLQFFYRHSGGPDEAVVLQQLPKSYNLTYSPNLQELIYIIEKLKEERLLERMGSSFKLTAQGWKTAEESLGGKRLKPCFVLLPEDVETRHQWTEKVLPVIEQCGYDPRTSEKTPREKEADYNLRMIADSKLLIADLGAQGPEVFLAGGYALGRNIPVIWTSRRAGDETTASPSEKIRPFVWETAEELASILRQRLTSEVF